MMLLTSSLMPALSMTAQKFTGRSVLADTDQRYAHPVPPLLIVTHKDGLPMRTNEETQRLAWALSASGLSRVVHEPASGRELTLTLPLQ